MKCKTNTKNIDPRVVKTKNNKLLMQSTCSNCKNKNSRFVKKNKMQKALEKKLNCKFIRINTSKENYDADYEASRIQTFISNFNKNKIKELEDEIKKWKPQLANPSVQNNDNNDNDNDNNK